MMQPRLSLPSWKTSMSGSLYLQPLQTSQVCHAQMSEHIHHLGCLALSITQTNVQKSLRWIETVSCMAALLF